jgi:DNA modification methylase
VGLTPFFHDDHLTVYQGDCREVMAAMGPESVHCVVTSPPYWGLRDYGIGEKGIGLEPTPEAFVANMVDVFREVRRVLRKDGTLWLNLGDSYAGSGPNTNADFNERNGHASGQRKQEIAKSSVRGYVGGGLKPKDLVGIPWRVAFALQADGWYLRSDIIWSKPNPMPESVTDRPTKAHEYLFLLTKSARYYYDADAVREPHTAGNIQQQLQPAKKASGDGDGRPSWVVAERYLNPAGRNLRSVWSIATAPYPGAHFATFPPKLVEPCVKAGCPEGGTVLDPFAGSGTTGMVAQALGRRAVLIDLNGEYLVQAMARNAQTPLGLVG